MDFSDLLKLFAKRVESLKEKLQTEEATKASIIMPFFQLLGYDVFNPDEFVPEYTADVGIKKGEKVDYAIMLNGEPIILIEAKWIGEPLEKHDSQLFRYFGTTKAKFAILTNGLIYKFYTDLEASNKMDEKPFLEINILDLKESQINELKKFHKDTFDINTIIDTASELKYSSEFKNVFSQQLNNPTDDFVKLFLSNIYNGLKTQTIVEKFRPIIKKSLNQYVTELMNDKIKSALNNENTIPSVTEPENSGISPSEIIVEANKITTTEEELEGFHIIKSILREHVQSSDIAYKDTESYFGILFQNNVRKWICRLKLNSSSKTLILPDDNKQEKKYTIDTIDDIFKYKEELISSLKKYI